MAEFLIFLGRRQGKTRFSAREGTSADVAAQERERRIVKSPEGIRHVN